MPASLHRYLLLSLVCVLCGDCLALATERPPRSETQRLDEAIGLQRDGHFDAALAAYRECLGQPTANEARSEALWRAGRLCEDLKRFREADRFYEQLHREFPSWDRLDEALIGQARATLALGKGDVAATCCQTLLAEFPQSPQAAEAACWLASMAVDEQERDSAKAYLDRMFAALGATSPDDRRRELCLQGVRLKCQLASDAGAWQEVVELLDSGQLAKWQDEAELVFWRAEAALRLRDYKTARRLFATLAPQVVGNREAWTLLVSLRRAQVAAHDRQWRQVLELLAVCEADYREFKLMYEVDYLRGRALAGLGDMDAARAAYAEVLQYPQAHQSETATQAAWMIGQTYFHQHDYRQAGAVFLQMAQSHAQPEWRTRAALQAGRCAELDEQWTTAQQIYAQAIQQDQDSDQTAELLARLRWVETHTTVK